MIYSWSPPNPRPRSPRLSPKPPVSLSRSPSSPRPRSSGLPRVPGPALLVSPKPMTWLPRSPAAAGPAPLPPGSPRLLGSSRALFVPVPPLPGAGPLTGSEVRHFRRRAASVGKIHGGVSGALLPCVQETGVVGVRPVAFLGPGLGAGFRALGSVAALSERERGEAGVPGRSFPGGGRPRVSRGRAGWAVGRLGPGAESRCGGAAPGRRSEALGARVRFVGGVAPLPTLPGLSSGFWPPGPACAIFPGDPLSQVKTATHGQPSVPPGWSARFGVAEARSFGLGAMG